MTFNKVVRAQTEKTDQRALYKEKKLTVQVHAHDKLFQNKFQAYVRFLNSVANLHTFKIKYQDEYDKYPTFWIGKGNNGKLVK